MTLSWPRLTWPAWDARQASPRWRRTSATSTAGRGNGRALAGHLQQKVERARHIGLPLQEMGGKAVPQRVNTDTFTNAGVLRCHANEPVE